MNAPAYFEIQAEDIERAKKFYADVFGWEFFKDENVPIEYWRIKTDGPNGGLLQQPIAKAEGSTNAFTCSMQVENFDATAEKILAKEGSVAMAKFAVTGQCWQGYFLDTEGNTFGIFQVDEKAR